MAFPKPELYSTRLRHLSEKCNALGYPARLALLDLLAERPAYVSTLVKDMPLVQGAVSAHLRTLRQSRLIDVEINGLYNKYSFQVEKLEAVRDELNCYIRFLKEGKGHELIAGSESWRMK